MMDQHLSLDCGGSGLFRTHRATPKEAATSPIWRRWPSPVHCSALPAGQADRHARWRNTRRAIAYQQSGHDREWKNPRSSGLSAAHRPYRPRALVPFQAGLQRGYPSDGGRRLLPSCSAMQALVFISSTPAPELHIIALGAHHHRHTPVPALRQVRTVFLSAIVGMRGVRSVGALHKRTERISKRPNATIGIVDSDDFIGIPSLLPVWNISIAQA